MHMRYRWLRRLWNNSVARLYHTFLVWWNNRACVFINRRFFNYYRWLVFVYKFCMGVDWQLADVLMLHETWDVLLLLAVCLDHRGYYCCFLLCVVAWGRNKYSLVWRGTCCLVYLLGRLSWWHGWALTADELVFMFVLLRRHDCLLGIILRHLQFSSWLLRHWSRIRHLWHFLFDKAIFDFVLLYLFNFVFILLVS